MYCNKCGGRINNRAVFCPFCGNPIDNFVYTSDGGGISRRNNLVALLLCLFVGSLGIHRFYVGKTGTGILMLLTCGLFGIMIIYDFIVIIMGRFRDENGDLLLW